MKKKTLWWVIGGGVVLLIVLIIIGKNKGDDGTKVAVEQVATHTITETVTASGKIYPETEVKISPEVSGEIIELTVQEGDSVRKGELLVKINPAIYSSMVTQAEASVSETRARVNNSQEIVAQSKAQYEQAQSSYNRNKKLYDEKVISAMEFEQAEASYLGAKASYEAARANVSGGQYSVQGASANLNQARENLRRATITAPTTGIISQLNVKLGERVVGTAQMAGTDILTIADMERIEVRVSVSETDIAKVKIDDTATIQADAYRNRSFMGVVSKVSVSSSTSTGSVLSTDQVSSYTVHILLLPSSYADLKSKLAKGKFVFKPGMSASVEIQTRKEPNILSVPINAVTTRDWPDSIQTKMKNDPNLNSNAVRQVVFVHDSKTNEVMLRDVKTAIQDNQYIQITEGLKQGENVVIAPYGAIARTLKDKAKVTITDKDKLYESKKED